MQQNSKIILVTGGAGYIGSHTVVSLIENGFEVVILDNFSNSHFESIRRVEQITNTSIDFLKADVGDRIALRDLFNEHDFTRWFTLPV